MNAKAFIEKLMMMNFLIMLEIGQKVLNLQTQIFDGVEAYDFEKTV